MPGQDRLARRLVEDFAMQRDFEVDPLDTDVAKEVKSSLEQIGCKVRYVNMNTRLRVTCRESERCPPALLPKCLATVLRNKVQGRICDLAG